MEEKSGGQSIEPVDPEDEWLIATVIAGVNRGATAEQLEQLVGLAPAVSTLRPGERGRLRWTRLELDGERPNECSLEQVKEADQVVFWVRPINSRNPKCVGVAWREGGRAHVFFGVICTP
jgi:hypothetical protein